MQLKRMRNAIPEVRTILFDHGVQVHDCKGGRITEPFLIFTSEEFFNGKYTFSNFYETKISLK